MMDVPDNWEKGLRSVLTFSFKMTVSNGQNPTQKDAVPTGSGNSGLRRILEGVLFSREFIPSYQVVLLVLLAIFTLRHWLERLGRLATRTDKHRSISKHAAVTGAHTDNDDANGSGVSSSSSTVLGTPPSPKASTIHGDSERMPLLASTEPPSTRWKLMYKVRSFTVYQPRPIPLINKALTSNGTTLAVLVFLGLQVFYVFYTMPLSIPMLFVFADRTSLLFVANLPLLYLFAAKNQPIKLLTGYSYESLNILHRRLGEVMCLLALLHSAGMIGVWYTILRPTGFTLARFLLSKIILLGIGALVAYELIYFTSLGSFRQRWYELFLVLHVTLQVVALVFVWFHHHNSRPYVGVALAIFLIDRLVYRMALKVQSSRASLETTEDGGTVILRTGLSLVQKRHFLSRCVGYGITNGWKATEHVFLTVPALSRKHIIQAHPFTIASRAPQDGDAEAGLKLIIRAQDGFSGDLLRYAQGHLSVKVRLDGPYGSQNALQLLQQCDVSMVVAGGSGIAVALPLIWAVHRSQRSADLETGAKKEASSRIVLIWVIRHESHLSWLDSSEIQDIQDAGIKIIIPPSTTEHGHPDIPSIIASLIPSRFMTSVAGAKLGVVCSGPDSMNRAVRNTCSLLLGQGHNIDVEIEKFGW